MQIEAPPVNCDNIKATGEWRGLLIVHTGKGKAVKIDQFMRVPSARFGEHRVFEQLGVPIEGLGNGFSWKGHDLGHSAQLARNGRCCSAGWSVAESGS